MVLLIICACVLYFIIGAITVGYFRNIYDEYTLAFIFLWPIILICIGIAKAAIWFMQCGERLREKVDDRK